MNVFWTARAWSQYQHWNADPAIKTKINALLRDIERSPFAGLGHPEPLRGNLTGWWSRRITGAHRLVYRVVGQGDDRRIEIAQCRYHY